MQEFQIRERAAPAEPGPSHPLRDYVPVYTMFRNANPDAKPVQIEAWRPNG